jgi:tetratricopeptide (TPR) repeat protein
MINKGFLHASPKLSGAPSVVFLTMLVPPGTLKTQMPQSKTTTPYTKRLRLMKLFGLCVLLLLVTPPGEGPPFVTVTAREQKDSEARQLLVEAEALRANWTASDLRQAKAKFDQAAQIWESFEDFSNAARATLKAGDVCFRLSEFAEAQKRYKSAEVFAKRVGDELLQSKASSWIGVVYSYLGDNHQAQI